MIIEARNISFSYKVGGHKVSVLKNVSLGIEQGEMIAIKGSSGSGKSTLLYILGCLLKPGEGRLYVGGHDLSRLNDEELASVRNRTIGFVFQQFHLLPRATVLDNILLPVNYPCETANPQALREENRARAIELATKLGLGSHLHHHPNQLSGGQQQRVAIARALMNGAQLILADEPTGNLDSKNAAQIIELLKELNAGGVTVVIVTHDNEVARHCGKIYNIKDGEFTDPEHRTPHISARSERPATPSPKPPIPWQESLRAHLRIGRALTPLAWDNLRRNTARSALTMLGIIIGIAAVLAMVTVGQFTKKSILASYEALGVNKIIIKGWPNWQRKASDRITIMFREFDWNKEIVPLRKIFPQITLMSPVMNTWSSNVDFGGHSVTNNPRVIGVGPQYFPITNRELLLGHPISPFHIDARSGVCVIGYEVARQLFEQTAPLGQVVYVTGNGKTAFGCKVIGVMKSSPTNNEWNNPDMQVLIPYSYFQIVVDSWWDTQIHEFVIQVKPGSDVEKISNGFKSFFTQKYGRSGRFEAGTDAMLVAEMKRFLNMFTALLASIAMISLLVGGIGITNMMLVSVSERFKEIGLRKALGATDFSIRIQFLLESTVLCLVAGAIGIVLGFSSYEIIIYGASKFVSKLKFEWVFDGGAFFLSVASIFAVGIASGLVPAFKAEKLEVIEALRSE